MSFKQHGKRYLSLFLCLALTVSMAACAGSGNSSSEPSESSEPVSTAAAESGEAPASTEEAAVENGDMTPYGRYEETVKMTVAKVSSPQPNFVEGESVNDNAMLRYIKDKVNVEIEYVWETEVSEFANKMALMMASGSLPDMFTLSANDYLLFKQMAENDMLADLGPAFEACANEHTKNTIGPNGSYGGRNLEYFYNDQGELLALAGGRYGYEHNQLWLRNDWLEASGLEEPKTLEDIETILTAWKENPPTSDYAGMLLHHEDVGGVYTSHSASPIFASFHSYPGAWVIGGDGNLTWGSVAPETKEGLAVLADWYRKGLIDAQFATRTASGVRDPMFVAGQTGSMFAPWWAVYSIGDFPAQNPGGEARPFNAPLDADGKYNIMFPGAAGDYVMIRKGFEHPEALFKVINCEFDMWFEFDEEGKELIQPNRDNNVSWTYMFPTSGFNIARVDTVPGLGKLAKAYVETGGANGVEPELPMYISMAERAAEYARSGELVGSNWLDYTGRYVASNIMDGPEINIVYPSYYFVTDSMADLKPNLDTLEKTTFLKIVMGELPVDAFDQFVGEWYAQGGQTMLDEVNALVK